MCFSGVNSASSPQPAQSVDLPRGPSTRAVPEEVHAVLVPRRHRDTVQRCSGMVMQPTQNTQTPFFRLVEPNVCVAYDTIRQVWLECGACCRRESMPANPSPPELAPIAVTFGLGRRGIGGVSWIAGQSGLPRSRGPRYGLGTGRARPRQRAPATRRPERPASAPTADRQTGQRGSVTYTCRLEGLRRSSHAYAVSLDARRGPRAPPSDADGPGRVGHANPSGPL